MGNKIGLHAACHKLDIESIQELLANATVGMLEEMDESGKTPLLIVANQPIPEGNQENTKENPLFLVQIIDLLVEKQVNLDHQDELGRTCLHYACEHQNSDLIACLLQHGAQPVRDHVGLLPQDFLLNHEDSDKSEIFENLNHTLERLTERKGYQLTLIGHKSSGINRLISGSILKGGSLITLYFDAPENHSEKDFIQVLVFLKGCNIGKFEQHIYVPKGSSGEITISTTTFPTPSICRFIYVKTDTTGLNREVVASECTVQLVSHLEESIEFNIYLYEKILEVESFPDICFHGEPAICLRRVGSVVEKGKEEIQWMNVNPGNAILAVNDEVVAGLEFETAANLLQSHDVSKPMKLLIHNSNVTGDFIPEKVLGPGLIGKFISLTIEEAYLFSEEKISKKTVREEIIEIKEAVNIIEPTVVLLQEVPNGFKMVQQLFQDVKLSPKSSE